MCQKHCGGDKATREAGYYWIQYADYAMEVAYWDGEGWVFTGKEYSEPENNYVKVLSARLVPPQL